MIFEGRNQIVYSYGCYGYTRGGGKTWHGGVDIVGLDSQYVRALRGGKVIRSRIVTDKTNPTWEWGNYDTILTDSGEQDIYAHLEQRLVNVGDVVKPGKIIGIMGNTGNAAGGYKHTHYERRAADGKTPLNPCAIAGVENKVGIYGDAPATVYPLSSDAIKMQIGPASTGDVNSIKSLAESLGLGFEADANGVMIVGPATSGDQLTVLTLANQLKLPYSEVGETPADAESKEYTATPLVDGLRLRPYPEASDDNANEALTFLTKGKAYPLVQTRSKWAYLLTSDMAGGWACIEDENGTYLEIKEV